MQLNSHNNDGNNSTNSKSLVQIKQQQQQQTATPITKHNKVNELKKKKQYIHSRFKILIRSKSKAYGDRITSQNPHETNTRGVCR